MTLSTNFAAALQEKFRSDPKDLANLHPNSFQGMSITIQEGKVYDRIVQSRDGDMYSTSVHAFIKRETGELIKAAGWKAPAKRANGTVQSKYNLSNPDEYAAALTDADPYGGYLYAR